MKALPFKIPKTEKDSFHIQIDEEKYFYDTLHQHPEIQLTFIEESSGNLIYGDYLGAFAPGDIFVIGPNVPHVFRNDNSFYQETSTPKARALTLFFDENTFGKQFLELPETAKLSQFVSLAERGMKLKSTDAQKLIPLVRRVYETNGLDRMILLLQILNFLSQCDYDFLTNQLNVKSISDDQGKRLDDIFRFTLQEYHRTIKLEEVASLANLSPSAFCRYFKQHTRKTYIVFLNEFRVSQACKLLANRDKSVTEVCYEVGFNNLSNFNRKFKSLTGLNPRRYQIDVKP